MTALDLGGTLFLSATHKNMQSVVCEEKYSGLKSVLIDTEDALDDLDKGLEAIKSLLQSYEQKSLLVFIRPRNVAILKNLLEYKNIEKIDGFILPKFSLSNAKEYLDLVKNTTFSIMPSIEGEELFEQTKLAALKEILLPYKKKIPLVRFGLEDMFRQLKMKRNCEYSVFDYAVTASVMGSFLGVFKGAGFDVSGGVFPCFKDENAYIADVQRDMKEGLVSKTIIHPNQIEFFNTLYKVKKEEYEEALAMCERDDSVFNLNGKMAEKNTMQVYAKELLQRARIYGVTQGSITTI